MREPAAAVEAATAGQTIRTARPITPQFPSHKNPQIFLATNHSILLLPISCPFVADAAMLDRGKGLGKGIMKLAIQRLARGGAA